MTPFVAAELVLALVVLLVVGALTFVWARRRFISGDGRPVMLCARRQGDAGRWRLGLARLSSDRFEWFSIVGPSLRAEVSWQRGELDFGTAVPLSRPDPRAGRPGGRAGPGRGAVVRVRVRAGGLHRGAGLAGVQPARLQRQRRLTVPDLLRNTHR